MTSTADSPTIVGTYYEARGSVRGACGHRHRTEAAAARCAVRDHRVIAALPGGNAYSDRYVYAVHAWSDGAIEREYLQDGYGRWDSSEETR